MVRILVCDDDIAALKFALYMVSGVSMPLRFEGQQFAYDAPRVRSLLDCKTEQDVNLLMAGTTYPHVLGSASLVRDGRVVEIQVVMLNVPVTHRHMQQHDIALVSGKPKKGREYTTTRKAVPSELHNALPKDRDFFMIGPKVFVNTAIAALLYMATDSSRS